MAWLLQFSSVCLLAWTAGTLLGRRVPVSVISNSSKVVLVPVLVLIVWYGLSWWARKYGDTDRIGWQWAEAWAHTGKWYALLGGVLFGIRFAWMTETKRTRLLPLACLLLIGVAAWRTMPVYFRLDEEQRDREGYLRQSLLVDSTCGGVALANYLEQFHKQRISEREISKVARTTLEGSTSANLVRAAHHYGLTNASARELTWAELNDLHQAVIVSISPLPTVLHATLLVELSETRAVFIDPAYGLWMITPQRFREIWRGKTIVLE